VVQLTAVCEIRDWSWSRRQRRARRLDCAARYPRQRL